MSQKTKQIIIALVVIIAAFFAFKTFFGPETAGDSSLVSERSEVTNFADGQAILALLDRLNSVTLDTSVFSDKIFLSLKNFERPIEPQVSGRQNPFMPIGMDSSGVTPPKGVSSTTIPRAR